MDENCKLMIEEVSRQIEVTNRVNTAEEFEIYLTKVVDELLRNNFSRLIQILYRLDVDEEKLKKQLAANEDGKAAEIIAKMIIERQLQKLDAKKKSNRPNDISEEEKW